MYRILAVDDDRTCLLLLKACLEKWNYYQVTTVKHAQEALSMLRTRSYDLVITEVHMPDMDGLELQTQINREFNLPVILVSADDRPEVMLMGLENGAQIFLVKPIVPEDLRNIWQFSEWMKKTKNNNTASFKQISATSQQSVTMVACQNGNDDNINDVDKSFSATSDHDDNFNAVEESFSATGSTSTAHDNPAGKNPGKMARTTGRILKELPAARIADATCQPAAA